MFDRYLKSGQLNKKVLHIFHILLYLRMICDHPLLAFGKNVEVSLARAIQQESQVLKSEIIKMISDFMEVKLDMFDLNFGGGRKQSQGTPDQDGLVQFKKKVIFDQLITGNFETDCSICQDKHTDPRVLKCGHIFCKNCIDDWWEKAEYAHNQCPQCKVPSSSHIKANV